MYWNEQDRLNYKHEINEAGQLLLSFSLGVLLAPYLYKILWYLIFLAICELGYWLIKGRWFFKLRIGLLIAYILGTIVCVYALNRSVPFI